VGVSLQPLKHTHTNLFIVESPIKIKTIEKFLGSEYVIRASVGHIADTPERQGKLDTEKIPAHAELKSIQILKNSESLVLPKAPRITVETNHS
jgi:DNA topoisomerase-1